MSTNCRVCFATLIGPDGLPCRACKGTGLYLSAEERQCAMKHGWHDKTAAKRAARVSETKMRTGRMTTYRCPHCGLWHNGHAPKKKASDA